VRLEVETLEKRALPSVSATPVFNEDFNQPVGALPSTSTWTYNNGSDPNNTNVRYVNDASTLSVVNDPNASDGKSLGMTIYPTSAGNQTFNSARINTANRPGGTVQYGLIEARIKLPGGPNGQGDGLWPAFWMLGANRQQGVAWPNCGEIDIMEQGAGGPSVISGATHFGSISGPTRSDTVATYTLPGGQGFYSGYHTFAVYWTPGSITFSVDGNAYATVKKSSYSASLWDQTFSQPFYMILNICDGGPNNSGGFAGPTTARSTFPQTMYVDYVRAYALTGISTPTNLSAAASTPNQVNLSWQAPANDETGFILQRSKAADFAVIDASFNLTQGTRAYLDTTASPGTNYFYRLQAVAADNARTYQSNYSNVAAVTTVGTPTVPAAGIDYSTGFTGATGLQLNGSAALVGSLLRLTNGGSNQTASAFTATKAAVAQFSTNFDFKLTNPNADGFTFAIQGVSPTRIGGAGGGLGYQGLGNSVAIKFDLYNNLGEGNNSTGLYTNGVVPTAAGSINLSSTGIDLHSGHTFRVSMSYDGTTLKVTIADKTTLASAAQSYLVNIPGIVGPTAYVGFTGGTGGASAIQDILAWTYTTQTTATRADLARNRPAFASSLENSSFPAAHAVDGNGATRWSSQFSDRQWIHVDLGATYRISEVKLNWERAAGKDYQIQVSADAASWTTIATIAGNTAAGVHDYTALSGTGRYVRVYCSARATPYGYSLYDLNVYGVAATAATALNRSAWTATASSTEPGGKPTNALDGVLATRWSSGKPMAGGEWFQIDLGSVQTFSRIALDAGNSVQDYARGCRILISNNGTDWATQTPVVAASGNSPTIEVTLASAVSARYVRIVQTGTASYWWSIAELNLYA
jgi:beta-glucanase (GH16 family)